MKSVTDPFLDEDFAVQRLLTDYMRHGSIILAYDYDNTVFDWHKKGYSFELVVNLIKECRPYAKFIVYTHSNDDRHDEIKKYLDEREIPWDTINEGIVWVNGKKEGKIFYSHFLDDRAGLKSAYYILEKTLAIIKKGPKTLEEALEILTQTKWN